MKQILIEIAKILWTIPNSNTDTIEIVLNPIETEEEANRLLDFLKDNKDVKIGYLIKHRTEIIKK